ncbi:SCO family protein [Silvibacterium dinghuense]|uniref:Redoxin domain-containing protein n=1 Tax=Silvibacterium dinghuense TaxID=1560006 RepID=A0A4Q1SD37_9BACT|nr:SCO family protein [Silvibacterium dinghuense]RXS94987.1 redoxin domain-containing protein [Silvibacterium dinghuense]GGH09634.1 electron transporter [Silvibacterium dinghuense]
MFALLAVLGLCGVVGCHGAGQGPAASQVKRYAVRGVVVSTDASKGEVTVDTEAIPGYMDAMIMPYKLKQPNIISELHPGDRITATLLAGEDSDFLDEIVIVGQKKLDYVPKVSYHMPQPGDEVPDFALLNENGQTVHLAQLHGKIVLLTFIYTRCPLADYCPRMSRNFAELDKALAKNPALYAKTHLLSVSFDPKYDTPKVLRSYGGAYTGRYTQETFDHWEFAAPQQHDLDKMLQFFLVGVTPEKDKTITHSLSTAVITPGGRIYKWYGTNDWTPEQILADVNDLAANK